jgi:hypothetical protein
MQMFYAVHLYEKWISFGVTLFTCIGFGQICSKTQNKSNLLGIRADCYCYHEAHQLPTSSFTTVPWKDNIYRTDLCRWTHMRRYIDFDQIMQITNFEVAIIVSWRVPVQSMRYWTREMHFTSGLFDVLCSLNSVRAI